MSLINKFKGSKVEIRLNRGARSELLKGMIVDGDGALIEVKSKKSTYLIPFSNVVAIKILRR
ncbi:MAG: hypothetical protein DRJ60_05805 [Thermoprotei archaeon]|nr:MAG: hypothetical protein DRJ60_05805 [Thermoprotei archaeon]